MYVNPTTMSSMIHPPRKAVGVVSWGWEVRTVPVSLSPSYLDARLLSRSLRPVWPLRGVHRNANVRTSAFHLDVDVSNRSFHRRRIDGVGGASVGLV